MPEEYAALVNAMKALSQGETPNTVTLKVAENGWNTRPDADSYGVIALEFEADALYGDDRKAATAYEGSVDLFSRKKDGGMPPRCDVPQAPVSYVPEMPVQETETAMIEASAEATPAEETEAPAEEPAAEETEAAAEETEEPAEQTEVPAEETEEPAQQTEE